MYCWVQRRTLSLDLRERIWACYDEGKSTIASVRFDGSTAAMAIEGATDTEVFRAYVREVLVPVLRPGGIVVMDNLSPHKSEATLALIEEAGAEVCFLPAYSPDLNPIEPERSGDSQSSGCPKCERSEAKDVEQNQVPAALRPSSHL